MNQEFLSVSFYKGIIKFSPRKRYVFPWEISQVLLFKNIIFVLLWTSHTELNQNYFSSLEEKNKFYGDMSTDKIIAEELDRNVIAFNSEGKEMWRMRSMKELEGTSRQSSYSYLYMENDNFYVVNLMGMTYRVDPKTGEVLEKIYTK